MQLIIKDVCKQKGVLLKDLATKLGISEVALRKQINGNPTIGTIDKIATALGVEVSELFALPSSNTFRCPNCGATYHIEPKE